MKKFLDKVWNFLVAIGEARANNKIRYGWY